MEEQAYIIGEFKAQFFKNESNFYTVLLVNVLETNTDYADDEIVITGHFGQVKEEVPYRFTGRLVQHKNYGLQFQADQYQQELPSSNEALVAYLSGPQFKGVGPKTASKIVDQLGQTAVTKIIEDPDSLKGIPGMSQSKIDQMHEALMEEEGAQTVIIKLNEWGINNKVAYQIYDKYENDSLEVIRTNPYRLIQDIDQFGFKKADNLAENLGIEADQLTRLQAGLVHTTESLCFQSGSTFVEEKELLKETIRLLESSRQFIIDPDLLVDALLASLDQGLIIKDADRYYIPSLYSAEWGISTNVLKILEGKTGEDFSDKDIQAAIDYSEKDLAITYDESQRQTIHQAIQSPLFIVTGGPGTGKTTVVNGIVSAYAKLYDLPLDPYAYKEEAFPIVLAAPTGRAAKRMNETTGLPASTIHRLLGLTGEEDEIASEADRFIEGDLLIIDEMSMVDTWLFNRLLQAVPARMQIILIGDADQLPSVSPGQVFSDLIASDLIPKTELTTIYRQKDSSSIPFLAQDIKNGRLPDDFLEKKSDRNFFPCTDDQVVPLVSQIVSKAIERGYTAMDIQVLAPMYKGRAGINALNESLQELFVPKTSLKQKEVSYQDNRFRIGDKVLQLVNEPEWQVFNGDIGTISSITEAKQAPDNIAEMTVLFDENEVTYKQSEWYKLTLAYCMSIHKSQGSEFPIVIIPFVKSYYRMLQKDILYTGITRASQSLILLGNPRAFQASLENTSSNRQTTLIQRLLADDPQGESFQLEEIHEFKEETDYTLTPQLVNSGQIDPMIGMEGISPYS